MLEDGGLVVKQYNFTLASLPSFSYTAFLPYFSSQYYYIVTAMLGKTTCVGVTVVVQFPLT